MFLPIQMNKIYPKKIVSKRNTPENETTGFRTWHIDYLKTNRCLARSAIRPTCKSG